MEVCKDAAGGGGVSNEYVALVLFRWIMCLSYKVIHHFLEPSPPPQHPKKLAPPENLPEVHFAGCRVLDSSSERVKIPGTIEF